MSMNHDLYIGPYARCLNPRIDGTRPAHACGKKSCERYGKHAKGAFCSKCGDPVKDIEVPAKVEHVDSDAVRAAFRENLHDHRDYCADEPEQVDCWSPNVESERETENFTGEEQIDDDAPRREKAAFTENYSEEIKVLKRFYGKDAVEIRWGMLGRFM